MSIHIPKNHYIGVRLKDTPKDGAKPLGFLTPGGTDAAATKRKNTVNDWCGINHRRYGVREHRLTKERAEELHAQYPDSVINESKFNSSVWEFERPIIPGTDFVIHDDVDNNPATGFRITKSISRGGWNGGNKVVRIEDPRGFELEISVDNLVKLMTMTTFIDGECQTECVWARDGAKNVLLPVNSDLYLAAIKETKTRNAKAIPLKQVKIGDTIRLYGKGVEFDKCEYYGLYRCGSTKFDGYATETLIDVNKRYVVKDLKTNNFYLYTKLTVIEIVGRADDAITERPVMLPLDKCKEPNAYWRNANIFVTSKMVLPEKISATLQYKTIESDKVSINDHLVTYKENQMVMIQELSYNYRNDKTEGLCAYRPVDIEKDNNRMDRGVIFGECGLTVFTQIAATPVPRRGWASNQNDNSLSLVIDDYEWQQMVITVEGQEIVL